MVVRGQQGWRLCERVAEIRRVDPGPAGPGFTVWRSSHGRPRSDRQLEAAQLEAAQLRAAPLQANLYAVVSLVLAPE